jgi:hypothetical protein
MYFRTFFTTFYWLIPAGVDQSEELGGGVRQDPGGVSLLAGHHLPEAASRLHQVTLFLPTIPDFGF